MATYNGERYIQTQLESILDQLTDDDEVVISDDGSDDATLSIIERFGDNRITILHHNKQPRKFTIEYAADNFENAMAHARGRYIFLSDQDDRWLPGKVEKMLAALDGDADVAVHDCRLVDGAGKMTYPSYFALRRPRFNTLRILIRPSHLGCCMAFRSDILGSVLPIPHPGIGHDLWIALIASMKYRTATIPDILVDYRKHEDCVTPLKSNNPLILKLKYRLCSLKAILKYLFN